LSPAPNLLYAAENEGFRHRIGAEYALRRGWMELPAQGNHLA